MIRMICYIDMHGCTYWASWSSRLIYGTAGTEEDQDDFFDAEPLAVGDDEEAAIPTMEDSYDLPDQPAP